MCSNYISPSHFLALELSYVAHCFRGKKLFKITVKPWRYTFLTMSVLGIASGTRGYGFPLILSILSTCGSLICNGTFCLVTAFQLFFFTLSSRGNP